MVATVFQHRPAAPKHRATPLAASTRIPEAPLVDRHPTRIGAAEVQTLEGLAPRERQLILRLFDGPLTILEALQEYNPGTIRHAQITINGWARRRFGRDAVYKESLMGRRRAHGFWIMKLDATIFEVEYSPVDVRDRLKLGDVLGSGARRVLQRLADLGWATSQEMREILAGGQAVSRINFQATRKGFPAAIVETKTRPNIFSPNPEFLRRFPMPVQTRVDLGKMFSAQAAELIGYLAEHGDTALRVLIADFDQSSVHLTYRTDRINAHCKELGLPIAIQRRGPRRRRMYCLTKRFVKELRLVRNQGSDIDRVFSAAQVRVLRCMEEFPFLTSRQMAKKLHVSKKAVHDHLRNIRVVCKQRNLPVLVEVRNARHRYALAPEFLERFGMRVVDVPVNRVLGTSQQVKLYRYFQRNPRATISDAARKFKREDSNVRIQVKTINGQLAAAGFPQLQVRSGHRASRYHSFDALAKELVAARIEQGHWLAAGLPARAAGLEYGIRLYGGMHRVMKKIATAIRPEQIEAIVRSDLAKVQEWDFSRYENEAATVRNAFGGAIIRGAERRTLQRIMETESHAADAIAKANGLSSEFGMPLAENETDVAKRKRQQDRPWTYV